MGGVLLCGRGFKRMRSRGGGGDVVTIVSQGTNPVSESQISLEDFNILKVIGRGSYAKVLMVGTPTPPHTPPILHTSPHLPIHPPYLHTPRHNSRTPSYPPHTSTHTHTSLHPSYLPHPLLPSTFQGTIPTHTATTLLCVCVFAVQLVCCLVGQV